MIFTLLSLEETFMIQWLNLIRLARKTITIYGIMFYCCCASLAQEIDNEPFQLLSDAVGQARSQHYDYNDDILKESEVHFKLDALLLKEGKLQMHVSRFEACCLKSLKFMDIDYIHKDDELRENGYMTIAKSAIIHEEKNPEFFGEAAFSNISFLEAAFDGSDIEDIDPDYKKIRTRTKIRLLKFIKLATIYTTVNFDVYSNIEGFLASVPDKYRKDWSAIAAGVKLPLEKITSTYSKKIEINPNQNSAGARTINFYYRLGENQTLHISYKVVSFIQIPRFAEKSIIEQQYLGTWESLNKVRRLPT